MQEHHSDSDNHNPHLEQAGARMEVATGHDRDQEKAPRGHNCDQEEALSLAMAKVCPGVTNRSSRGYHALYQLSRGHLFRVRVRVRFRVKVRVRTSVSRVRVRVRHPDAQPS